MRLIGALAALLLASLPVHADDRPSAVVELFTSQGCSSCPPADARLAELARRPGTIALTFPVDYWDYLGWKDTLAKPAFTARQRGYAAMRGDRGVFTPQMVVNGRAACIGSNPAEVETLLERVAGPLPVELAAREGAGQLDIHVGAGEGGPAELWLLAVDPTEDVQIGRGENAGQRITYVNVVREVVRIGTWTGAPARFAVQRPIGADGWVILLQTGDAARPGAIIAAAKGGAL